MVLFGRLVYTREILPDDQNADPDVPLPSIKIEGSRRAELAADGQAQITVGDNLPGAPFWVQIESLQGTVLWRTSGDTEPEGDTEREITVPKQVLAEGVNRPDARPTLVRTGRFVRLDDQLPDFNSYRLFVAPIRPDVIEDVDNPQIQAVRHLVGLDGEGEVTTYEVVRRNAAKLNPSLLAALNLQPVTLRPDGAFNFSLDIEGDETSWAWLLLGPEDFAGHHLDALPAQPRPPVTILLPVAVRDQPNGGTSAPAVGNTPDGAPSFDFDEQQLIDHPDAFSDDPGRFCTPFENPQRILGERRFFTILRMDQPEIGGQASLKVSRPILLDLAPPIRMSAVGAAIGAADDDFSFMAGRMPTSGLASTSSLTPINALRLSAAALAEPRLAILDRLERMVFQPTRRPWIDWVERRSKPRAPISASNPIEWDGDPTIYQASSVAGGHVLEWRVQWRSNGYSLGNVAHALTLAPRQTRRIARISWQRREAARRRERTDATDALTQVTTRARDYTDAVQSSLSEWSSGGSKSRTTGVAGGIGFAMGPVVIGGGAAHGQASSESWQQGGRRVAAAEQQQLRDAIRQFGESVRSSENTIVTEITQEEEVEGVSETLRNVNYCHALSVLYYEILRHLRVDTAFAGVRECLFVPFSVTPFDIDKALKWRDKLRHGVLDTSLRWALDRLDEVASAWADSDIPPGRRMDHPVNHVTGSAYIKLSIDRPREQGATETMDDYFKIWSPLAPLLSQPARQVIANLAAANERARDLYFQREVAPGMAARWADNLRLQFGTSPITNIDFTLATTYRYGGTVRVDFTVPVAAASLNRAMMQQMTLLAGTALPPGSVASLERMSLHYYTDHFDRAVDSDHGVRDLVTVETGQPDGSGAAAHFPLSAWEREDLRAVIEDGVAKLLVHLNANSVYYHKVIWWLMDRDELYMMLDGFTAPYGRRFVNGAWVEDPGRSIASVVERDPMAILGNCLVFRVAAGAFLGINGHESPDEAYRYYYDSQVRSEPLRVSLPTEGLYAQALMDRCEACEEHFGSVDWVLSDKDPELELLADQLGSRRAAPEGMTPTPLAAPIIALQNAPNAPDPQGLAGILGAVTNSGAFRDMAGLAGTQANAMGALNSATSLATSFGQMAVDFQKSKQGTADAKHKLSNISKAKSEGLIDDAEAKRQAATALSEQNMSSGPQPLAESPTINTALGRAGAAGLPIEVTRQGQQGAETVRLGNFGADIIPASFTTDAKSKSGTKLPSRSGTQAAQAWETLAPIGPRLAASCPTGLKNLGTLLFIHDAETEIDLRDYGGYTNADAWMLVHTVSDLIEGLRAHVGNCGYVTGIHIEAHGGWSGSGGFRMGDDTDGDGHVESGEAQDMVSSAAHAAKFGSIVKNAFGTGGTAFISVAACNSSGSGDAFIKALRAASGTVVIGSVDSCRSGGNWFHGAWWEAEKGRSQVNMDGSIKVDTRDEGTGIWRPF
ncbi:hypothetical protein [Paracoccus benzoatiresistens]|uniref:Uncharacterized protein n=1 Tax=Paracoccus benzoatiresistens TaxID=2997341 RepID=A0ABT4J617_9RHOB|nr:hypothetical protein [Paracoccus sp. EF6]MCZ0962518.1 hypothetical protein [Paracoccus sp. EF6]